MIRSQDGIKELKKRLEYWRSTREKRSPMPSDLWESAVSIARERGVYAVTKELGLSYDSLKKRMGLEPKIISEEHIRTSGFVELTRSQLTGMADSGMVTVEMVDGFGGAVKIRLPDSKIVDVCGLVELFWNRRK